MRAKLSIFKKGMILISVPLLVQMFFFGLLLDDQHRTANGLLLVGTGVAFLLTVCMAFLFSRSISSRLATVAGNAERLALNQELNPAVTGSDEVARLDQAFRAMAGKLTRSVASLRESDERFRLLMENVVDYALILLDTQGRIVSWNAGAQRLKGYRPAEILGKHFSCFYPPEANERRWPEQVLTTAARQGRCEDEGWRVRKDGSKYWGNVVITALRDEAGQLRGFAKLTRDLSERKQAEDAIRRLNDDLEIRIRERTAELLESNRELSHKNQENETFVYSVSHDLRSPLVNLQGFSQELSMVGQELRALLDDERLAPALRERGLEIIDRDMAEATHFIQTAVKRLSNIIDALLRLSRAGRVEYQWQHLDVHALVERVVESMHATVVQRGATVSIGSLPAVRGDATAIEQLFANLIGNALQYLDATRPGMIEIGSLLPTDNGTADGLQTFFVRDNGLGIPESGLKKVFQAFQRVHPEVAQGEGMGLAIVRRIVERHRGKIWVESTVDEGSTFFVALPSTKATAREPGEHSDRELAAAVQA